MCQKKRYSSEYLESIWDPFRYVLSQDSIVDSNL